jgi:hypothetical protein
MSACGQDAFHGDSTVRIFKSNISTAELNEGIIVYGYNTIDGRQFSFAIHDSNIATAYEFPNGPGFRFMAIGASNVSGQSYADYNSLYCAAGKDANQNNLFNLDGGTQEVNFTFSTSLCNDTSFNAVQFQTASGGLNSNISFESCTSLSTVSGASCTVGLYGSYQIEQVAFEGAKSNGNRVSVFNSACIAAGSGASQTTLAGDQDFPFFTRVTGFASSTICNPSIGTRTYEFPKGLGTSGASSTIQSASGFIKIFLED